jgi:hypothetical protein
MTKTGKEVGAAEGVTDVSLTRADSGRAKKNPGRQSPLTLVPVPPDERMPNLAHLMAPYGIHFLATTLPPGLVAGIAGEFLVHGKEGDTRKTHIGRHFRSAEVSADAQRVLCLFRPRASEAVLDSTTGLLEVDVSTGAKTTLWHGDLPAEPESRDLAYHPFYVAESHIGINCAGSILLMRRSGNRLEKSAEFSIADTKENCHLMKPFYGGRIAIGVARSLFLVFGFHGDEIALLAKQKGKKGFLILQGPRGPYYLYPPDQFRIEGIGALYRERFGESLPGDPP